MYYENIFIVNPDVSQGNTEALTDALVSRVEKAGGRIVKREYWGVRPLAYGIAKRKRGHYTLLVVDGEPEAARALEQALSLDESVLRFLTTRLNELSDTPSPLMRRKTGEQEKEATESRDESEAETIEAAGEETTQDQLPEDLPQENAPAPTDSEPVATETTEKDDRG